MIVAPVTSPTTPFAASPFFSNLFAPIVARLPSQQPAQLPPPPQSGPSIFRVPAGSGGYDAPSPTQGRGTGTTPTDPVNRLLDLVAAQYQTAGATPGSAIAGVPIGAADESATSATTSGSGLKVLLVIGLAVAGFFIYRKFKKSNA